MIEPLEFTVHGSPAPQGSKVRTKWGMREASKKVQPWREAIVSEIIRRKHDGDLIDEPIYVSVEFRFRRPKSHYGTLKGQPYLKATAPHYVSATPDIDKCLRSTFDALTQSGLIADDARIAYVVATKRYCVDDEVEGAVVRIRPLTTSD